MADKHMEILNGNPCEPNKFLNIKSNNCVRCAFDKGTICGPDCAACEISQTNEHWTRANCSRGHFIIGAIKITSE